MPFCPNCRFEYLPGVTHCPDCNAALVAELPPAEARELTEEELEPVQLCTVEGDIHARLLRAELEAQGIPSRTQSGWSYDPLLGAVGAPPPPFGGTESGLVAIFVNRVDLERAMAIYHDFEDAGPAGQDEPEEEE